MIRRRQVQRLLIPGALVTAVAIGWFFMAQSKEQHQEVIAVELERSGGQVPTLRPKFRVDLGKVSRNERDELQRHLTASDFFRQPARIAGPTHPDAYEYRLTVQTKDGSHSVTYHDDDGHHESIDTMADWIRAHQSHD
jgi:hypothetical protein